MLKNSIKVFIILIVSGLLFMGCANDNGNGDDPGNVNDEVQILQFVATVLEIDENTLLVEPVAEEEILQSGDRVSINTGNMEPEDVPEMEEGDRVRIFYTGDVMESYPLQLEEVQFIVLVEEEG